MKPAVLEPVRPWSYTYYGPDPAAGISYGMYRDEENELTLLSAGEKVFSPASGEPMKFISQVPAQDVEEHLKKAQADMEFHEISCKSCMGSIKCSADLTGFEEVYCCLCGAPIELVTASLKQGDQTMDRIQEMKDKIRARFALAKAQASAEKIKARMIEASEEEEKKANADEVCEEEKKAKADECEAPHDEMKEHHEEEKKEDKKAEADDEYVSLDEIMKAMGEEEKKAKADEVCEEEKKAKADEEKKAASEEGKKVEKDAKDDFLDLDMVLSAIQRKERAEKIAQAQTKRRREKILARIKARREAAAELEEKDKSDEEKKAKAEEEKKAKADEEAKKMKSEEEKKAKAEEEKKAKAEEAKKAKAEEEAKKMKSDEHCEEEKSEGDACFPASPENPVPAPVEHAEGMKFEPLAAVEALASVAKEDIEMVLYGQESENPTWNVTVAGVPTARIQLKAQVHPDEIRRVFCSEEYAMDLIDHCAKAGFLPTMQKVGAEFWANKISQSKIAAKYKSEAETAVATAKKKMVASFREDFLHSMKVIVAGMNKNFYPIGNPLKDHFFTNLVTVGLPQQTAETVIERSFAQGSAEYFNTLFDKATEFMNLSKEARTEIAAAISDSSTLEPGKSPLEGMEPATLAERMVQASVAPMLNAGQSTFQVTPDLRMDSSSYKAQLKNSWKPRR